MKKYLNYILTGIKILAGWLYIYKSESSSIIKNSYTKTMLAVGLLVLIGWACKDKSQVTIPQANVRVGAYYFDGWAGVNAKATNPMEPWAKTAPTHLTRRFVEEFPDRQPVWGWRDDAQSIMERQIDLAADNGIEFFIFCWYWKDDKGAFNRSSVENLAEHTSLNLYMNAKNKNRIKFSLLIANHKGSEIVGPDNWDKATQYWMKYLKDPQFVKLDSKPLVVIFSTSGIDSAGLARMQDVSKRAGLPGLSIAGCGNTTGKAFTHKTHYNIVPGYSSGSEEHSYSELVDAHKIQWLGTAVQPYIPELTVGWDKRPWEGSNGLNTTPAGWYYPNRTPELFKSFLKDAITWMDTNPTLTAKERFVFVYAWNELGEGGYLLPTIGDPEASYLNVIKNVVAGK